ncbi:MAG: XdhC family protein [Ferruginibacter sp.]
MNTWLFIQTKQTASIDVILLYVLESKGSSPGRQGFKMAVAADNDIFGTIGGGIMEHKFVEMAKARLQETLASTGLYKQVHDKKASKNQSGMICSGEQTIFLYRVQQHDTKHIHALINSLRENRNGTLQLSPAGITFSEKIPAHNFYFEQADETGFLFLERTGYKNRLHIIGGGHCALALSKLMKEMDFYITVYDEREGLNTMEQNVYAHEKKIITAYTELNSMIESGEHVYVVIMTFGYRSDDIALKALLNKLFKYIGVLGSKKKMEKMFAEYRQENIDEKVLKNIHSPIGIQVKSQTSWEIAVSIAAEIIAVKNSDQ